MIYINQTFDDNDELMQAVKEWDVDFKQIDGGNFNFLLKQISTPGSIFAYACCNRVLDQYGSTPKGMKTKKVK